MTTLRILGVLVLFGGGQSLVAQQAPPAQGESPYRIAGRLPGRVFFPLTRCNPSLPAAADGAFRPGLARDPDERPASLPAFARLLREALGG